MQGERQSAYVLRANRALQKQMPNLRERMSRINQEWSESGAEAELQTKARAALASVVDCDPNDVEDHFVIRKNKPVFTENIGRDPAGNEARYDATALAAIVDRCNKRILDTGDLAALSIGHTPDMDQMEKGMPMPPMCGLAGPFRLGLIGDEKPQWAIFADEAIFKSDWPEVMKRPRRSAEVWVKPKMADRVLDPIAVLGSETPALDLGLGKFSRRLDIARYRNVARYSMGSLPGGSNTYAEKFSENQQSGGNMDPQAISEIVKAVVESLVATPQWQYLTDQMQTSQNPVPEAADAGPTPAAVEDPSNPTRSPADPTAVPAPGATPESPAAEKPPESPAPAAAEHEQPAGEAPAPKPPEATSEAKPAEPAGEKPPEAPGEKPVEGQPEPPKAEQPAKPAGASPEEVAAMGDDEKAEYSAMNPDGQCGYMCARRRHAPAGGTAAKFSNATERAKFSRMESENHSLKGEVQALRADRTYRERFSKLHDLNVVHEFDVNQEADECKGMTDAQFENHCNRIVSRYSRRDPSAGMPDLLLEPLDPPERNDDVKREKYSRRAVEIASKADGKLTWDEALQKAREELG